MAATIEKRGSDAHGHGARRSRCSYAGAQCACAQRLSDALTTARRGGRVHTTGKTEGSTLPARVLTLSLASLTLTLTPNRNQ